MQNMKPKIHKNNKPPKLIFGALLGAGLGIVNSIIGSQNASKQREAQEEQFQKQFDLQQQQFDYQKQQSQMNIANQMAIQDKEAMAQNNALALSQQAQNDKKLAGFDTTGIIRDFNIFRNGGALIPDDKALGLEMLGNGSMKKLSSTGGEFMGPTHKQGGITIGKFGVPIAEVEKGEGNHTIEGMNFISSNSITNPNTNNTIAQDMIALEKSKGRMEKTLMKKPYDFRLQNSIGLQDRGLKNLALLQETLKMNKI